MPTPLAPTTFIDLTSIGGCFGISDLRSKWSCGMRNVRSTEGRDAVRGVVAGAAVAGHGSALPGSDEVAAGACPPEPLMLLMTMAKIAPEPNSMETVTAGVPDRTCRIRRRPVDCARRSC